MFSERISLREMQFQHPHHLALAAQGGGDESLDIEQVAQFARKSRISFRFLALQDHAGAQAFRSQTGNRWLARAGLAGRASRGGIVLELILLQDCNRRAGGISDLPNAARNQARRRLQIQATAPDLFLDLQNCGESLSVAGIRLSQLQAVVVLLQHKGGREQTLERPLIQDRLFASACGWFLQWRCLPFFCFCGGHTDIRLL